MLVKDVIEMLQKCEPNALVVLAKDGEGNSFSPLDATQVGWYVAESEWDGSFYTEEEMDAEIDSDEEDVDLNEIPAVVLWPIN